MDDNKQIRDEMANLRQELKSALAELKVEAGKKLKPDEWKAVEDEFKQIDELLERIGSGLIWVSLFGKTAVGKSAIANALIGEDLAEVGVQHDLTTVPTPYKKPPWMIVDVPGVMGKEVNEKTAIEEAKKSHGHIFVIDGEPLETELKLFDIVHKSCPDTPKFVFVNKWDVVKQSTTKANQEIVRGLIEQKMKRFVKSSEDIVYGSAAFFDINQDVMVRQELPQLLDRLYSGAGTFGEVINVLDPAKRSDDLTGAVRKKVMEVRIRVARKVVNGFAIASVVGGFVPFSQLAVTPALMGSMVFAIFKVMGKKGSSDDAKKMAIALLKACGSVLFMEFSALVAADLIIDTFETAFPFLMFLGLAADATFIGYYEYRRTAILGEVAIEYIRNDFSWGAEGQEAVIKRCKKQALEYYAKLKVK